METTINIKEEREKLTKAWDDSRAKNKTSMKDVTESFLADFARRCLQSQRDADLLALGDTNKAYGRIKGTPIITIIS